LQIHTITSRFFFDYSRFWRLAQWKKWQKKAESSTFSKTV